MQKAGSKFQGIETELFSQVNFQPVLEGTGIFFLVPSSRDLQYLFAEISDYFL